MVGSVEWAAVGVAGRTAGDADGDEDADDDEEEDGVEQADGEALNWQSLIVDGSQRESRLEKLTPRMHPLPHLHARPWFLQCSQDAHGPLTALCAYHGMGWGQVRSRGLTHIHIHIHMHIHIHIQVRSRGLTAACATGCV